MSMLNRIMIPGLTKPYDVAIVAIPYYATGNIYINFDGSASWSTYALVGSTNNVAYAALSKECVLIGRTGSAQSKVEYSVNLLANRAQAPANYGYSQCVAISDDGNVLASVFGSSSKFQISTNKGSSWSDGSLSFGNALGLAMKSDGSKIWITNTSDSRIYYSTDYGQTWSNTGILISGYVLSAIGVSADGTFIYAGLRNYGDRLVMSSDGGANWSTVLVGTRTTGTSAVNMSCSASGQYVFFHTLAQNYVSNDYGQTWTRVLSSYPYTYSYSRCVSRSGKYMVVGDYSNNGKFYYSDDYGVTWSQKTISGVSVPIRAVVVNEY